MGHDCHERFLHQPQDYNTKSVVSINAFLASFHFCVGFRLKVKNIYLVML